MTNSLRRVAMIAVCSAPLLWASPATAASGSGQYGIVHFPVSCKPGVQEQFERAVAMLHSFFYPETVKAFEAIIATDPDCAMAYWGRGQSQARSRSRPEGQGARPDRPRARLARRAGAGLRRIRQRSDREA